MVRNSAFVFIKPHALTDKVKDLVKETFEKKDIAIKAEGQIEGTDIDKKMLIDKHYYAIASKATILSPDKIPVPKDKFKEKFGCDYDECVKNGTACNATGALEKLGITSDELDSMWGKAKKSGDLIKFGGGFYCAKLEKDGKGPFYAFNGFFMSMRSKFVAEGSAIYYYVVEWSKESLTWKDFRGQVLGPTDPTEAPADSLRGRVWKNWKDLGLSAEPNTGDNAVHASASPFEGLAERMNWLNYRAERDPFGKLLLKAGVTRKQIKDWSVDPQVTWGPIAITGSLFDTLEDQDSDWCLAHCQMISGACSPQDPKQMEAEINKLKKQIEAYAPLAKAVVAIQNHIAPKALKLKAPPADEKKGGNKKAQEPARGAKASPAKGKGKGKGRGNDDYSSYDGSRSPAKGKGKGRGKSQGSPKGKGKGKGKR